MTLIDTEAGATDWLEQAVAPSARQWEQLRSYVALLVAATQQQNLIAASTIERIWSRHVVDSAQLMRFIDRSSSAVAPLADLGSGAGLPGVVLAILLDRPVKLIESRGLRATFLTECVAALGLEARVSVAACRLEAIPTEEMSVITARAFAPLDRLLSGAARFAGDSTQWLLPKGRNGANEWEALPSSWRTLFHVEHSLTDADSVILVGRGRAASERKTHSAPRKRGK